MTLDQGFTDEFIEQFSNQGLYAAPNRTKINIFLDGQQWLVGNAIVANIEQTNEKIPVYSYNSPNYSKYLNRDYCLLQLVSLIFSILHPLYFLPSFFH